MGLAIFSKKLKEIKLLQCATPMWLNRNTEAGYQKITQHRQSIFPFFYNTLSL